MRTIAYQSVVEAVAALCEETLFHLREDIHQALEQASVRKPDTHLELLLDNARFAARDHLPLCRDPGTLHFLLEIGDQVELSEGSWLRAIHEGVQDVHERHPFPISSGDEPFRSTSEQGPKAQTHFAQTQGEQLKISCLRLDAQSEEASQILQLTPPFRKDQLKAAILEVLEASRHLLSPPLIVGVGLGSSLAQVGLLAYKALLRPVGKPHQELEYASLEQDLLDSINELPPSPEGFGGELQALAVHIEASHSHRSLLPVCVYLHSHTVRTGERNF